MRVREQSLCHLRKRVGHRLNARHRRRGRPGPVKSRVGANDAVILREAIFLALFGNLVAAIASRGTEATGLRQRWTPAADGTLPFPPERAPHDDATPVWQRPEFLLEVRGGRRLRRAPEALVFPPRPSITSLTARPRSSVQNLPLQASA